MIPLGGSGDNQSQVPALTKRSNAEKSKKRVNNVKQYFHKSQDEGNPKRGLMEIWGTLMDSSEPITPPISLEGVVTTYQPKHEKTNKYGKTMYSNLTAVPIDLKKSGPDQTIMLTQKDHDVPSLVSDTRTNCVIQDNWVESIEKVFLLLKESTSNMKESQRLEKLNEIATEIDMINLANLHLLFYDALPEPSEDGVCATSVLPKEYILYIKLSEVQMKNTREKHIEIRFCSGATFKTLFFFFFLRSFL